MRAWDRRGMAEAVMGRLEELGVGGWMRPGDRVARWPYILYSLLASICLYSITFFIDSTKSNVFLGFLS